VVSIAKEEQYPDLFHRILAVPAWDLNSFFVSFSSVYRILRAVKMITMRWIHKPHNGRSLPPLEACSLLEEGLIKENILDLPEDQRPGIINDPGRQMKAKSIKPQHRLIDVIALLILVKGRFPKKKGG
jgi:hypothetical protein